jgi:hypothetical protein
METVDQLRADIDAGRTRDKVPGSDPAAAPLGTDEEAAGTPISPEAVALARRHEVDTSRRTTEDGGTIFYVSAVSIIGVVLVAAAVILLR